MKVVAKMSSTVKSYGHDIIESNYMEKQRKFIQHGNVTVFQHCFGVACLTIYIARLLPIKIDERALIRGALLHDYFLYDWHQKDKSHRWHGFTHAMTSLNNAQRDFELCPKEKDIIIKHMFPLNIAPPLYKESIIVCIADKICALWETLSINY